MDIEKTKTEMVNIDELLKSVGVRSTEEPKQEEIDGDDVLKRLIGEDTPKDKEGEVVIPPTIVKEETPKQEKVKATVYTEQLQNIIKAGFIEDAQITWGEGEEAKDVFLSELTDLDQDQYDAIIAKYKEAKDAELKERYISVDGLDERTKKYIELKKAGGDISQLVEKEVEYVNPLSQFDLDNELHQEHLVRQSLQSQGYKPKYIDQEIEEMKADLTLDTEAKKIADAINRNFDEYIESKRKEQLEKIELDKVAQKEFRKNIGQSLKELIPNESIQKLILDNATKRDDVGLTNTDKLYFDSQKDPKVFAEVAYFLNNREEFYKTIGAKAKNKETQKTVKALFSINPQIVKSVKQEQKPDTEGDKVLAKLTSKFNQ